MLTLLIGIAGTLAGTIVGSLLTQRLQRRNAAFALLHQARIDAYRTFAAAIMEYRKALMDRWYVENEDRQRPEGYDVYAVRSAAWAAHYQVLLVAEDSYIVERAVNARDVTSSLKHVNTRAELDTRSEACRKAVQQFADAARREIVAHSGGRIK